MGTVYLKLIPKTEPVLSNSAACAFTMTDCVSIDPESRIQDTMSL